MAVICTGEGRVLTVNMTGEVDHHHARTIMTEMEQAVGAALPRQLILDLSGIAVLLRAYRRASEIGAAVRVTGVPEQAWKVLKTAGLERLMTFESETGGENPRHGRDTYETKTGK